MVNVHFPARSPSRQGEHYDVIVLGAGISGIGAAYHLKKELPDTNFVVLDERESFGGTWISHRYPGLRSDSDLYTFGYGFKPWKGAPIATAREILAYLGEVIEENDLSKRIRYRHCVRSASWSSKANLWTLEVERIEDGSVVFLTTNFLWMCQGYYRHSAGYTPKWDGLDAFKGHVVHPQNWPADLALDGQRVIVIGSGATAATLIPAIADRCAHVTMLQRSPTYFRTGRNAVELADTLRELQVDEEWIHEIVRRRLLVDQFAFTSRAFSEPEKVRKELLDGVRAALGPGSEEMVEKHFTPKYLPWRQRVAFVPDGDLFKALKSGQASIVTDEIARFTENGIRLKSGQELTADIVVTATGFEISALGDIPFEVDGKKLDFGQTITYRGMMFTDVPNLAWVMGYFRASWTLRADLVAEFVCRLLGHMRQRAASKVEVALREEDQGMDILPWVDDDNFNPGYIMRGVHLWPKRGDRPDWRPGDHYWTEKAEIRSIDLDDSAFVYDGRRAAPAKRKGAGTRALTG